MGGIDKKTKWFFFGVIPFCGGLVWVVINYFLLLKFRKERLCKGHK
jgi:hypothetical protein